MEVGVADDRPSHLKPWKDREQVGQCRSKLGPGEVCAEAEVSAVASESEVRVWRTPDVEDVAVWEYLLVAICRCVEYTDGVP